MNPQLKITWCFVLFAVIAAVSQPVQADQLAAQVSATLNDGRNFEGALRVVSFRSSRINLFARGLLIGTITDDDNRITHVVSQRVTLQIQDVHGESDNFFGQGCDFLVLETAPFNLQAANNIRQVDSVVIEIDAGLNTGFVGSELCDISDNFNARATRTAARDLNDIIDNLEAIDDFRQ